MQNSLHLVLFSQRWQKGDRPDYGDTEPGSHRTKKKTIRSPKRRPPVATQLALSRARGLSLHPPLIEEHWSCIILSSRGLATIRGHRSFLRVSFTSSVLVLWQWFQHYPIGSDIPILLLEVCKQEKGSGKSTDLLSTFQPWYASRTSVLTCYLMCLRVGSLQ